MMRYLLCVSMVILLACCSGCEKSGGNDKPAPEFKLSLPENNAVDVDVSSAVEVTFDEVVTLAENHGITINNNLADVKTDQTKLIFSIDLSPETNYEIHIPVGAVINTFNVALEKGITLNFNTQAVEDLTMNENFYIFLCFGQSNMEGQGTIETQDQTVDSRFQVLQSLECSNLGAEKDQWRTAVPPLCQCYSGLSPADYFGRTMVENLPEDITVGVVNVAIGGCDIRLFDKSKYQNYTSTYEEAWFTDKVTAYGGNPYEHLINLAKMAQERGVIKGILLHQGETNTGDNQWPSYVKTIYTDMLNDLSLDAAEVPLLAGEVVHADQQGICASMNEIINTLPDVIPTAHIVSSSGCTAQSDNVHFNSAGYRELGRRYAKVMLTLLGIE